MTTDNTPAPDPWLERRARSRAGLDAQHAKLLTAPHPDAAPPALTLVSGPGDPDAGAREPNAATPTLLAALDEARQAGDHRTVMALNAQMLTEISRAARTDEEPDFNRPPLDAA